MPKEIFNKYSPSLTMGNHDLSFNDVNEKPIAKKDLSLRIAHFPIGSKEQCMSKVLVGWPNLISINTKNKPWGWHWKNIFEKIQKNIEITAEDIENFAKNYTLESKNDITLQYSPINLDFCKNINREYTNYTYNYLNNILNNSVELANEIKNLKNKLKN